MDVGYSHQKIHIPQVIDHQIELQVAVCLSCTGVYIFCQLNQLYAFITSGQHIELQVATCLGTKRPWM